MAEKRRIGDPQKAIILSFHSRLGSPQTGKFLTRRKTLDSGVGGGTGEEARASEREKLTRAIFLILFSSLAE